VVPEDAGIGGACVDHTHCQQVVHVYTFIQCTLVLRKTLLYELSRTRPSHVNAWRPQNIKSRALVVPEDVGIGGACVDVLKMLLKREPSKRASFEVFFEAPFVNAPPPSPGECGVTFWRNTTWAFHCDNIFNT
jgi:hypothetical protein